MNLTNLQRLLKMLIAAGVNPAGTLLLADPNGELKLQFTDSIYDDLHQALLAQGWVFQNNHSYNYRPE